MMARINSFFMLAIVLLRSGVCPEQLGAAPQTRSD
jgi:hypothetical protein